MKREVSDGAAFSDHSSSLGKSIGVGRDTEDEQGNGFSPVMVEVR